MESDKEISSLVDRIAQQGEAFKNGTIGAREGLMKTAHQLFSSLIFPAEMVLYTQWAQPAHTAILRLGSDIKLFQALAAEDGSSKSSKAIADMTDPPTEHKLVARALRHLSAMGTVKETGQDTFAPTQFSKSMAQEDFKDAIQFMHNDFNPCLLTQNEYFRENGYKAPTSSLFAPFQFAMKCKGDHLFDYFAKDSTGMGKRFASMMQVWSRDRPKWFQNGYYPVRERLFQGAANGNDEAFLVDVGGGSGHDISQLLGAFGTDIPGKLILQDRPEVIQIAEKELGPEIVKMGHDFLVEQPVKNARAYFFHSIMQDWEDHTNQQILRSIVPAMKGGYSKILINDYVIPDRDAHWLQTGLDWELMEALAARHRTESEMRAMIESVGLKVVEIFKHPLSLDSLIEVELA